MSKIDDDAKHTLFAISKVTYSFAQYLRVIMTCYITCNLKNNYCVLVFLIH